MIHFAPKFIPGEVTHAKLSSEQLLHNCFFAFYGFEIRGLVFGHLLVRGKNIIRDNDLRGGGRGRRVRGRMPMRRRGRCPQVARWVRMDACKSCAEFGAVPRLRSGLVPSVCPLARPCLRMHSVLGVEKRASRLLRTQTSTVSSHLMSM